MIGFDHARLLAASALALGFFSAPTCARAATEMPAPPASQQATLPDSGRALHIVTLVRDGLASAFTTNARTVGEFFVERGIVPTADDRVSPPTGALLGDATHVELLTARPFTLVDHGVRREIRSTGATVSEVLASRHIHPGPRDVVLPGLFTRAFPGGTISVAVRPDAATKRRPAPAFFEKYRRALATRVVRGGHHPQNVARGLGEYAAFARLAHRGFQSTVKMAGTAMRMVATAYTAGCAGCTGRTASGLLAGHGVVAVDPRVIPLGTRLYIPGYGKAVAGDTGGAIKGARMDLGFDRLRDALLFGRREITVFVLRHESAQ